MYCYYLLQPNRDVRKGAEGPPRVFGARAGAKTPANAGDPRYVPEPNTNKYITMYIKYLNCTIFRPFT